MAEEYSKRISEIANTASIGFAMALAKDTGILTALREASKPLTSQEIADLKGLKERYVREILGSLSSARLVRLETRESGTPSYFLHDEEKQGLHHEVTWPFISMPKVLASRFGNIRALFDAKGPYGLPYGTETDARDILNEFSAIMDEPTVNAMLTNISGLIDRLEAGIDVIEFGCGSGRVIAKLATKFPKSQFAASEVVPELVDNLRAKWGHISNISFEVHNLCHLKDTMQKKYDFVYTIDVIHDLPKPQEAVDNIRSVVKEENGIYALVEPCTSQSGKHEETVGNMTVAAFYGMSTFMCVPESFQEDDSVALGMCAGKQPIVDLLTKGKFKSEDFKFAGPFSLFVCKPVKVDS